MGAAFAPCQTRPEREGLPGRGAAFGPPRGREPNLKPKASRGRGMTAFYLRQRLGGVSRPTGRRPGGHIHGLRIASSATSMGALRRWKRLASQYSPPNRRLSGAGPGPCGRSISEPDSPCGRNP